MIFTIDFISEMAYPPSSAIKAYGFNSGIFIIFDT